MGNRRDLLKLMPLALLGAEAGTLSNGLIDDKNAKLDRQPFGDIRTYFDGPTGQLKSLNAGSLLLKPGMSPHPPHQHPEEEIMIVTEGTGEISVDGNIAKVAPGSMMYCAGGKLHGIVNTGSAPLLFYFFKWQA
jgi:quercetin dioxygenase-like cupin family protein